jgi:hypothetical protein
MKSEHHPKLHVGRESIPKANTLNILPSKWNYLLLSTPMQAAEY